MAEKRTAAEEPVLVQFICPKCGRRLLWAQAAAMVSCPACGKWVTYSNRRRDAGSEVYLPAGSDQTVLF